MPNVDDPEDMLPEYNLAAMGKPVIGKHYEKYRRYIRMVRLPDELADRYPDEDAVLEALRRDTERFVTSAADG